MQHYEATAREANGSASTSTTPYNGSTLWADQLRDKYGIAAPMAPDDGRDDEMEYIADAHGALN